MMVCRDPWKCRPAGTLVAATATRSKGLNFILLKKLSV